MHINQGIPASTVILGPGEAEKKWQVKMLSFKRIQRQEDVLNRKEIMRLIQAVFAILGITEAYAPHVRAKSARVVLAQSVKLNRITLNGPGEKSLWRNDLLEADGIVLPRGEAFMMCAGDCPVIIATGEGHMIVAHAGRESLLDREFIMTGERPRMTGDRPRTHASIVDSIVQKFREYHVPPAQLRFHVMYAIHPDEFIHHLNHPIYGEYNRKLLAYLQSNCQRAIWRESYTGFGLDLGALIMAQSARSLVGNVVVTDYLDEYPDLTHTRKKDAHSELRNLIAIKHT